MQRVRESARPGLGGIGRAPGMATAIVSGGQPDCSINADIIIERDGTIRWRGKDMGRMVGRWWAKKCSPSRGYWCRRYNGPGLQASVWDALRPDGVVFTNVDTGEELRLSADEFERARIEDTLTLADGAQFFVKWPTASTRAEDPNAPRQLSLWSAA